MALLSIQINHPAATPKHNAYKRHDKLGYSSICYIGSKIGWNRWDHRLQIQNLFMVTLGQQYNIGEKPTVIMYTYINRHAGTPDKNKTKTFLLHKDGIDAATNSRSMIFETIVSSSSCVRWCVCV